MAVDVLRFGREGAAQLVEALCEWTPRDGYLTTVHAGDVGWLLRLDDADLSNGLVAVVDGAQTVAVGLLVGSFFRPTIRPDRLQDCEVAMALVAVLDELPSHADADTDATSQSAYRALLCAQGWQLDPDAWVLLHRPLSAADGAHSDELSAPLRSDVDIADRVRVQTGAFTSSTFTVARWRQMAAGPGFDPALEYLRRNADGVAVAAATGWSAGKGKVGILEPVGTDRAHAGHGHGKAVSMAVIAALARGGASAVTVFTPASNAAAVKTYERCGLRQVELVHALHRPAARPAVPVG